MYGNTTAIKAVRMKHWKQQKLTVTRRQGPDGSNSCKSTQQIQSTANKAIDQPKITHLSPAVIAQKHLTQQTARDNLQRIYFHFIWQT